MNTTTNTLSDSGLGRIYTDPSFRNSVAWAHKCMERDGTTFKHLKTCEYPIDHIVSPEQVAAAKAELERAKAEALATMDNKLVFVGMGMTYAPRYADDVCNYRIRTEIRRADGKQFFIELGSSDLRHEGGMRCDHSIERVPATTPDAYHNDRNNYEGIERRDNLPRYTLDNVRKLVNRTFDTHFTEVEVDNHTLSCDDFVSIDPGPKNTL